MGRIPRTTATGTARDEWRLRELARRTTAASGRTGPDGPAGCVGFAQAAAPVTTSATTQAAAAAIAALDVATAHGRRYRVSAPDIGVSSAAAGLALLQVTYTLTGAAPSVTSTRLKQTTIATDPATRGRSLVGFLTTPPPDLSSDPVPDPPTLRLLLAIYGLQAGTYTVVAQGDWPAVLLVEDLGPAA